ncbi:hypothetical protein [Endozoicomonas sp. GU-1]
MGGPMAQNLVQAGPDVCGYDQFYSSIDRCRLSFSLFFFC